MEFQSQTEMRLFKILICLMVLTLVSACAPSSQTTGAATASATDQSLKPVIANMKLASLPDPTSESADLVILGETLFADPLLSGNRETSCLSCHSTSFGLGDGLPISVGTGAHGFGTARMQVSGVSFAGTRNAPALFNLGRPEETKAFFDGRVSFTNNIVSTPVAAINGASPVRSDIKNVFTNVYDIQPLFPLINVTEMLGTGNDLASQTSSTAVWDRILQTRLLNQSSYVSLFSRAYPTLALGSVNPGHIGRAIGAFLKTRFKSNNTPFDSYLEGDITAMSEAQKRGMLVFYTKGQCFRCHAGSAMTDHNFHASGAPQIGLSPFVDDLGLGSQTGSSADNYRFKTPSLRNLALTAPYMHDGAFASIEDVVEHYSNISRSLASYRMPASYQSHYETTLVADANTTRNANRLSQVDNGAIRNGLNLSTQDKSDLVDFLKNALTDPGF